MKDYIMGTVLKVEDDTRRIVHQKFIWFNGGYWTNWFQEIDEVVALLLKQGFGVLEVEFQKTEPANGILAYACITYWDHP
jgi:hypothetical protein